MNVFARCHRSVVTASSLAALACFLPLHLSAVTVVVSPAGSPPCVSGFITYTSVQAAVTAVTSIPGSVIKVCPGTYYEQVNISSKLTLGGIAGLGNAVIAPPAGGLVQNGFDIFSNPVAAQIFVASTSGPVTIERLTVDGTGNNLGGNVPDCAVPTLEGIYFQNTSGTIASNAVRNQYQTDYAGSGGCQNGLAINVESTTSSFAVTVSGNSVRAYQKNGITATGAATGAGSPGPDVTIETNFIVGLGATAMNWPVSGAAENGIQVGFGASGKVTGNVVNDNIWGQDTSSQPYNAASGILIFASKGISVTNNSVGSAQFGIALETDGSSSDPTYTGFCGPVSEPVSCGSADDTIVTGNKVVGTQIFDAIDVCSNGNTIGPNSIYGSSESGVHIDDSCTESLLDTTSGNGNAVSSNTINEACAGILLGTGTSGNTYTSNTSTNTTSTTLAGDVCPAVVTADARSRASSAKHRSLRPSPYKSGRR